MSFAVIFAFIPLLAPVSKPTLSAVSGSPEVVLGKPLWLICRSAMGTPPITFTFYKGNDTKKIVTNDTYATFLDENIRQNDKRPYKCGAKNNHSSGIKTSNILNITVIGKFILLVAHISIFETVAANGGLSKMDVKCLQIFVT